MGASFKLKDKRLIELLKRRRQSDSPNLHTAYGRQQSIHVNGKPTAIVIPLNGHT